MHSMLQAMGREIVRQECPHQPKKQSRLYLFYHIKYVLEIIATNRAIEEVKAIVLDLEQPEEDLEEPKTTTLWIENLSHLSNLRLLIFQNVKFSGTLNDLPSKLQYISWHEFPFTRLPSFQSDMLVQLIMPNSNLTAAWKGKLVMLMFFHLFFFTITQQGKKG
ncbi:probable WRKY transcription factor 19 [Prosopis cineraria]|uniref:probable WRKY transcription factor 19 n=1 Tax=Prosopis cineraria TaxID=364024 RepID=UPI00240ED62B|nr:probable WRKY transcription factor 19 [Prosopis cineraria]